ncbi:hypothetical protein [Methanosarcina sp. UBA411]|jgi:hypothetical protein|nr:hypothetical protein [Methanosarcina sp. UBA411]
MDMGGYELYHGKKALLRNILSRTDWKKLESVRLGWEGSDCEVLN